MIREYIGRFFHNCIAMTTHISPKLNTKLWYLRSFGKMLNLENPKTFNEKILWLKLNTYLNNKLIKQCADKYSVREYLKSIGREDILNELIAVYDKSEDIEWDKLPNKFAMKYNIGCGANIICSNKLLLNRDEVLCEVKKWFYRKYYLEYSEMQYKDVKPKIIVEKYLGSGDRVPEDYKFFCINGKAEYVMVCLNRYSESGTLYCMYDRNWKWHKLGTSCKSDPHADKPPCIDKAFEIAEEISQDFPFVRTDLYIVDGKIYFGEYTFTPCAGLDNAILPEVDLELGEMIKLK